MSFSALLRESLAALRVETPSVAATLAKTLGARRVSLVVDGDAVRVAAAHGRLSVLAGAGGAEVRVVTGRHTILALADGRQGLVDAILSDTLALYGAADDLIVFHDALVVYLSGAVRAPSFGGLLRRYRAEPAPARPAGATSPGDQGRSG